MLKACTTVDGRDGIIDLGPAAIKRNEGSVCEQVVVLRAEHLPTKRIE
jgi:hypothetical protein